MIQTQKTAIRFDFERKQLLNRYAGLFNTVNNGLITNVQKQFTEPNGKHKLEQKHPIWWSMKFLPLNDISKSGWPVSRNFIPLKTTTQETVTSDIYYFRKLMLVLPT